MRSRRCTRVPRASCSRRSREWRATWDATVAAEVDRTRRQLDELGAGLPGALRAASVVRATPVGGDAAFGMCGRLTTWDWKHDDNDHP